MVTIYGMACITYSNTDCNYSQTKRFSVQRHQDTLGDFLKKPTQTTFGNSVSDVVYLGCRMNNLCQDKLFSHCYYLNNVFSAYSP